jgi:mannose-1-phosphate guanylyltransferase
MKKIVFILAGGDGKRLRSVNEKIAKQFLKLGSLSLFEHTLARIIPLTLKGFNLGVVTKKQHLSTILASQNTDKITEQVIEPEGRNTAPAIILSCLKIMQNDGNATLIFLPADHCVTETQKLLESLTHTANLAQDSDYIFLLGTQTKTISDKYGYIITKNNDQTTVVSRFIEKPQTTIFLSPSESMILQNTGIIIAQAKTIIKETEKHCPRLLKQIQNYLSGKAPYSSVQNISLDFALLQQTDRLKAISANFSWQDLGSPETFEKAQQETTKKIALKA